MSRPALCAVCAAPVPVLCFRRSRSAGRQLEALITVGRGENLALSVRSVASVHVLCEEHHAVWAASALGQAWLARQVGVRWLGFTARQFGRFASEHGMSARALKKRLVRDGENRARADRRKLGRHDWAVQRARELLFEENPWAKFALAGAAFTYGVLGYLRPAA
jgi:hypothetical protein